LEKNESAENYIFFIKEILEKLDFKRVKLEYFVICRGEGITGGVERNFFPLGIMWYICH
jgi:hypothetical protein